MIAGLLRYQVDSPTNAVAVRIVVIIRDAIAIMPTKPRRPEQDDGRGLVTISGLGLIFPVFCITCTDNGAGIAEEVRGVVRPEAKSRRSATYE